MDQKQAVPLGLGGYGHTKGPEGAIPRKAFRGLCELAVEVE